MITLDLVRHGPAYPASPTGDAGRALSAEGRRLIERLAARLEREAWNPVPGYVSPLLRARETAEILAGAVTGGLPLIVLPELHPDGSAARLFAVLSPLLEPDSHVVLVGHQPLLGDLTSLLSGQEVGFAAGTLARVVFDGAPAPGAGRVAGALEPPSYF